MLLIASATNPGAAAIPGTVGTELDGRPNEAAVVVLSDPPAAPDSAVEVSSEPGEPVSPAGVVSDPGIEETTSEFGVVALLSDDAGEAGSEIVVPLSVMAGPPGIKVVEPWTNSD